MTRTLGKVRVAIPSIWLKRKVDKGSVPVQVKLLSTLHSFFASLSVLVPPKVIASACICRIGGQCTESWRAPESRSRGTQSWIGRRMIRQVSLKAESPGSNPRLICFSEK